MMKRWSRHVYNATHLNRRGWGHFPNAIRRYGSESFSHEVLEICYSLEVANLAEECWIEFYDTTNPFKGFNLAKGGSHIPHPIRNPWNRPEFRTKALAANKKATSTDEFRRKASNSAKKLWQIPGMREKISQINSQHVFTEEHRAKLVAASAGRVLLDETRAKISNTQLGKPRNPESIAKSAASRKGRKLSPELKELAIQTLKSHRHTLETIQKITEKLRARPKSTHCKRGHSLKDAYVVGRKRRRFCRTCASLRSAKCNAKRRMAKNLGLF